MNWLQTIKDKLKHAFAGVYDSLKTPFYKLKSMLFRAKDDKKDLKAIREDAYDKILHANEDEDYVKISKDISISQKEYIRDMISQEEEHLGPPPCDYSVVTFGSMARNESGPVTDLEIGIMMEKNSVQAQRYFRELSQRISDRLFLLGEHPDIGGCGLRMDEADHSIPHKKFVARNTDIEDQNSPQGKSLYEGSRPFLGTPGQFAHYSKADFDNQPIQEIHERRQRDFQKELSRQLALPENKGIEKDSQKLRALRRQIGRDIKNMHPMYTPQEIANAKKIGAMIGRNVEKLYGSETLYDAYKSKREHHLAANSSYGTRRQEIAMQKHEYDMQSMLKKGDAQPIVTGKLTPKMDLKRDIYRFGEQFLTNLGYYHNVGAQNTTEIAEKLIEKGVFSPAFGDKVKDFLNFATYLRLKQQAVLKRQGSKLYLKQEVFEQDKATLEQAIEKTQQEIKGFENKPGKEARLQASRDRLRLLQREHTQMLEMAPGKVLSNRDLQLLQSKYLPLGQEIFNRARTWTGPNQRFGFDAPLLDHRPLQQGWHTHLHKALPNVFFHWGKQPTAPFVALKPRCKPAPHNQHPHAFKA